MGDGFAFIDIILLAMVAAFLVYRLRSVLGRRTGHEKRHPDPFAARSRDKGWREEGDEKVVPLPERGAKAAAEGPDMSAAAGGSAPLAAGLNRIAGADPSFTPERFLAGAETAFRWIVEAFAKGDTEALRPLLSNEVYNNFASAVEARERAGETLETQLLRIKSADLLEAELQGRMAFVTVKFVSEQVNVTRDEQGEIVDGDPERTVEITDIWTFARNLKSRDPNWTLVATRSQN